jgi:hypothetical protein
VKQRNMQQEAGASSGSLLTVICFHVECIGRVR